MKYWIYFLIGVGFCAASELATEESCGHGISGVSKISIIATWPAVLPNMIFGGGELAFSCEEDAQ